MTHDEKIKSELGSLFHTAQANPVDLLENFIVYVRRQWLKRFLAHASLSGKR